MYTIDETADEPIMMLDGHIGYDPGDGQGVDGPMFAQELLRLDGMGKKAIHVYINCPGGSVTDGMSIFSAMLKSKTPVDTHNIGIAASMGGVCFMGGRKRTMSDYASLMLHNPSGGNDKAMIDSMTDSICTMLTAKSATTKDDVSAMMNKETWLNSAEAFAKGFCTDIAITSEANKKRMPISIGAKALYNTAKQITNNIFNKNTDMKKVTARVKLVEGSNEDSIVEAIDSMENSYKEKVTALTASEMKLKADLKVAQDNATKLQTEKEALEKTQKDAAEAADVLRKTDEEKQAGEIITNAVKVGKIKNDAKVIAGWKKQFVSNFADTKELVESLPISRTAPVDITETGNNGDNAEALKVAGSAAGRMHAIATNLAKQK